MKIDDYHKIAVSTAAYEGQGRNPTYPALGLAGEAAEFGEKVLDGATLEQLAKEAGDVLWYVANMAREMRADLRDVAEAVAPGCEEFDCLRQAVPRQPVDHGTEGRLRAALRLAGRAGNVCERVKKLYRDDGGELTEERRGLIMAGLSQTLAALASAALVCGLGMSHVAELNAEKLLDRKKRGHIKGDGDDR
jgi:NTP pyrophosphatase (non-canonical NTP hydrolase)